VSGWHRGAEGVSGLLSVHKIRDRASRARLCLRPGDSTDSPLFDSLFLCQNHSHDSLPLVPCPVVILPTLHNSSSTPVAVQMAISNKTIIALALLAVAVAVVAETQGTCNAKLDTCLQCQGSVLAVLGMRVGTGQHGQPPTWHTRPSPPHADGPSVPPSPIFTRSVRAQFASLCARLVCSTRGSSGCQ
jgi:hypothetical protein